MYHVLSNKGYNTAFGNKILRTGNHHYKFKIIDHTGNSLNWNHVIGISHINNCESNRNTYYRGYGYITSKGKLVDPDKYGHYGADYGIQVKGGDIVEMFVNLNSGQITYLDFLLEFVASKNLEILVPQYYKNGQLASFVAWFWY